VVFAPALAVRCARLHFIELTLHGCHLIPKALRLAPRGAPLRAVLAGLAAKAHRSAAAVGCVFGPAAPVGFAFVIVALAAPPAPLGVVRVPARDAAVGVV
jgi:hypothetical protein